MASPNFDIQGALDAGYSEDEIKEYIRKSSVKKRKKNVPENFDYEGALQSGYSENEIDAYLESQKPKKTLLEKAGRVAGQFALGAAESALLPYEIASLGVGSKGTQVARTRETIAEDVENLLMKKASGDWSPEEENELENLRELWKNPEKIEQEITHEPIDIGVRGLAERATGLELHPEGILEKAANWIGFLKEPKKWLNLVKSGLTPKEIVKTIAPSATETLRGVGAGIALQAAEEGEYGPIGTIAAAVIGDIAGMGVAGAAKSVKKFFTQPKKVLAETAAKFTPKEKVELQKDIIKEFRDAGIQADLGTLTDSNLVKWTQARLSQSGLTGKSLSEFRDKITNQIKEEYKVLADSLGEAKYLSTHEAGEATREGMKAIREADLATTRNLYTSARQSLKPGAVVESYNLAKAVENLEKSLKPGSIKSTEQQAVLSTLDNLRKDIFTSEGKVKLASVEDLMNNKVALNDIINYEVQGGAKQLLKNVVAEIDRAIISHGKQNIPFVRNYISANKKFSEHAKTFRNKTAKQLIDIENPAQILNKMNSVHGIRSIGKILNKTPEGKNLFNNLKRHQLEEVVGKNLVDSTTKQVKLGTFSKLLEKGKNKEIIKEILGPQNFKRLERLQKNAGRLADAANKFYNASQSGVAVTDAAILAKGLGDIANMLSGNPWPIVKTSGGIFGARKLSGLLADPEFLKLTEEVILASEKGSKEQLVISVEKLRPYIVSVMQKEND